MFHFTWYLIDWNNKCGEVNEFGKILVLSNNVEGSNQEAIARSDIQGNKTPLMFALADKHWSGTLRMVREYRFSSLRQ